jgi:hypothetical protein
MLALKTLLELLDQKDTEALSEAVIWYDDELGVSFRPGVVLYRRVKQESTPAPLLALDDGPASLLVPWLNFTEATAPDVLFTPDGRPRWKRGDVFAPVRFYVCEALNNEVRGRVHPKLMPFAKGDAGRRPLSFEPDSLVTSLYLMLQLNLDNYRIVAKGASRECLAPACKRVFPARGNQRVCGDDDCQKWLRQQRNLRYNLPKRAS